jgi:hypothetical protein
MDRNDTPPPVDAVLRMMQRMHTEAASSESQEGAHASSAGHDQKAAKYRNAADKA